MSYLLVGSTEGADWDKCKAFSTGSFKVVKEVFQKRKRPFVIWYLIDTDKLSREVDQLLKIELIFFKSLKKYPDLVDRNYHVDPFVGFYDMIATSRSWGILKTLAKKEVNI